MGQIFAYLCFSLYKIGRIFGWDYKKASVYICIHLWPLLCVAMAVVMLGFAVATTSPLWITVCTIYALINAFGYWAVIRHYYPGTTNGIFQRCRDELIDIAEQWGTTYAVVNLVIYVLLFVAIMVFDVSLIMLMR